MSARPTVAAIACGTNSTRLLVVDGAGAPLERQMRITRLGQGVEATRQLTPEAMERTMAVLREYRDTIDSLGAERLRITATSAVRDAGNRDTFLAAAEDAAGIRPELLGGEEEARLSYRSATVGLDATRGRFLVVDIGGGSTEFAVGPADGAPDQPEGVRSVDMGCVRVTETFLHTDPPSPRELSQALAVIRDRLEDVSRDLPASAEASQMVLLAGTMTSVAMVKERLAPFDQDPVNRFVLSREAVEDLFRALTEQKQRDRGHDPGLEAELADLMVGGTAILATIMRHFDFDRCLVSDADILDGLVLSLLERPAPSHPVRRWRPGPAGSRPSRA